MKRTEAKNIGQIINDLLRQENLDVALDEHRASALWPQIVGDGINRYGKSSATSSLNKNIEII